MAALCPTCGKELDVTLFQFGRAVVCDCGTVLHEPEHRIVLPGPRRARTATSSASEDDLSSRMDFPADPPRTPSTSRASLPPRRDPEDEANRLMDELRRRADAICRLILRSDFPLVDVGIERARLRDWCEAMIPERLDLYEMVYESRFDRLIEQFGRDRPE
jgi:hypothetical protein